MLNIIINKIWFRRHLFKFFDLEEKRKKIMEIFVDFKRAFEKLNMYGL